MLADTAQRVLWEVHMYMYIRMHRLQESWKKYTAVVLQLSCQCCSMNMKGIQWSPSIVDTLGT